MPSRQLSDLHPRIRSRVQDALERCETDPWLIQAGITVLVTCTARSRAEQAKCYAQGRTREQLDAVGLYTVDPAPGPIVTRALPGKSAHNETDAAGNPASCAVDVVPLRYGKPIWGTSGDGIDENPADDRADDLEAWQRVAVHFKAAGLKWYGEPGAAFRELPHFQDPAWRSEVA